MSRPHPNPYGEHQIIYEDGELIEFDDGTRWYKETDEWRDRGYDSSQDDCASDSESSSDDDWETDDSGSTGGNGALIPVQPHAFQWVAERHRKVVTVAGQGQNATTNLAGTLASRGDGHESVSLAWDCYFVLRAGLWAVEGMETGRTVSHARTPLTISFYYGGTDSHGFSHVTGFDIAPGAVDQVKAVRFTSFRFAANADIFKDIANQRYILSLNYHWESHGSVNSVGNNGVFTAYGDGKGPDGNPYDITGRMADFVYGA